jgi:hypothetical protein
MTDISWIAVLVAVAYLFAIILGAIKSMFEGWNQKKTQNRKSTKESSEEPHAEYQEEPDYPDPEDADLIEWDLDY